MIRQNPPYIFHYPTSFFKKNHLKFTLISPEIHPNSTPTPKTLGKLRVSAHPKPPHPPN
ncbi:MAG: hypothetical protein MJE68_19190 [Proteobacteria bacterium]|nr:hypothetical protein [Pseudomonadota bacterium]